jgi:hypothetical protein
MARESLLIIIEKYDGFVNYIYPIVQNMERRHGTVKEMITQSIFIQVELFYKALKSDQKSKLHEADANLATIRYWLRFMADDKRRFLSQRQHQTASIKIDEVGKILGTWIRGK